MTSIHDGTKAGEKVGLFGLYMNGILAAGKMFFGLTTGVLSLFTDGVNNLMDCFSSGATFVGLKLSQKPADRDHPYGHDRIEYIVGFIISLLTGYVAIEFFRKSIGAILHPEPSEMTLIAQGFLLLSILVKALYGMRNHRLFKRYGATIFQANRQDAFTDMIMSTAIFCSSFFFDKYRELDGTLTLLISLLLLFSVYHTIRDTVAPLIGAAPDWDDVATVEKALMASPIVVDMHNLNLERKSMGQVFATVDVEVEPNLSIQEAHDTLEILTAKLRRDHGIQLIIHMEPAMEDKRRTSLRRELLRVPGVRKVNDIIFDEKNLINIEIEKDALPKKEVILEECREILQQRSKEPWDIDVTVSF